MEPVHLLSLGAGVQSSTLALMIAAGEILPMPMAAIFADTQAEPAGVYEWLDWLENQLPFPVYRVTKGDLGAVSLELRTAEDGRKWTKTAIPFFVQNADGTVGRIMHRSCTRDYKIEPIMKKARELGQIKRGQKDIGVVQWIGISLDEIQRMKPAREPWAQSRWPLIELRMTRAKCLEWMESNGFPQPPRSACVFCPFHHAKEWRRLQVNEPDDFARAVQFERDLQAVKKETDNLGGVPYLTAKCVPLDQIDFRSDIEKGQQVFDWSEECEGMCGV